MTKRKCPWCGRNFAVEGGPGRPRVYCKTSCKQRDYEARRRTAELGIGEHELVITREELEATRDRVFVLACIVEDVERDIEHGILDEHAALSALLDAARDFTRSEIPTSQVA